MTDTKSRGSKAGVMAVPTVVEKAPAPRHVVCGTELRRAVAAETDQTMPADILTTHPHICPRCLVLL